MSAHPLPSPLPSGLVDVDPKREVLDAAVAWGERRQELDDPAVGWADAQARYRRFGEAEERLARALEALER